MDIIYVLVPLSIVLIGIAIGILFWAVRSGQFEDLESPAHKILFDDDDPISSRASGTSEDKTQTPVNDTTPS